MAAFVTAGSVVARVSVLPPRILLPLGPVIASVLFYQLSG